MASAKFLEEALSTDVDESAVNAIVGSLEHQLDASSSTAEPTPETTTTATGTSSPSAEQGDGASSANTASEAEAATPQTTAAAAATTPVAPEPQPEQQPSPPSPKQQQTAESSDHDRDNEANGSCSSPATASTTNPTTTAAVALAESSVTPTATSAATPSASPAPTPTPTPPPPTLPPPPQQQQQQTVVVLQAKPKPQQQQHVEVNGIGEASPPSASPVVPAAPPAAAAAPAATAPVVNNVSTQEQTSKPPTPIGTPAGSPPAAAQPAPQQQAPAAMQATQQQPQFANQVTTSNPNSQLAALAKVPGEHVKFVYPGSGQVISTTGVVNANNKLTFPSQNVAQLANGALGVVTTQTVLTQASTSNAPSNATGTQTTNQATTNTLNVNKPTALVIKTSVAPSGMVSVPMSLPVTVAANMTNNAQQAKPGQTVTSTIVPSNVQIVNVNTVRPGTPVAGQQAGKQVASRVVIGQHMMGGRAGAPGITLQTLQGLQAGTPGHLLLKTENGQFQILRVGPAPTPGTPGGTVTPNSISGTPNAIVASPGAGTTTYRLATLPATVAPTVTTTTVTPTTATNVAATTTATAQANTTAQTTASPTQVKRPTTDNTKEKCRKFLANLLELSSREPRHVERNVRTLIQELIDVKVEPEEFCVRLEKLLNASPQPCLIGFLKKSLPLLRQSLVTQELIIEGIRPPPASAVFPAAAPVVVQNQIRPPAVVGPTGSVVTPVTSQVVAAPGAVAASPTAPAPLRVLGPGPTITSIQRPSQPIVQQRIVRPGTVTTIVRPPGVTTYPGKTVQVATTIQQQQQVQHQQQQQQLPTVVTSVSTVTTATTTKQSGPASIKSLPSTAIKTGSAGTKESHSKANAASHASAKSTVPSSQSKATPKEKEKKTFSSAGYTGDDDINDVAAMGGVNLAEESQRILGSTKFVGTQIRSCKDEVFLHMSPLQQRINKIVSSYGLEEPSQEVASLISHAAQERLKNLVEKLAVIAEHRIDLVKVDPRYEATQDVRAQLKFLEELDKAERKRHEEAEREALLKVAKSRAKTEDPEQAKLKAKAKEMQRVEMEEARQREANQTALQAIGPRKKPRLELGAGSGSQGSNPGGPGSLGGLSASGGMNRQMPVRPRLKRVNFRDLLFLLEQEKETCRSTTLYRSYLK